MLVDLGLPLKPQRKTVLKVNGMDARTLEKVKSILDKEGLVFEHNEE